MQGAQSKMRAVQGFVGRIEKVNGTRDSIGRGKREDESKSLPARRDGAQ